MAPGASWREPDGGISWEQGDGGPGRRLSWRRQGPSGCRRQGQGDACQGNGPGESLGRSFVPTAQQIMGSVPLKSRLCPLHAKRKPSDRGRKALQSLGFFWKGQLKSIFSRFKKLREIHPTGLLAGGADAPYKRFHHR